MKHHYVIIATIRTKCKQLCQMPMTFVIVGPYLVDFLS